MLPHAPGYKNLVCIASVADPRYLKDALDSGAHMIELRLDLWDNPNPGRVSHILDTCSVPLIVTVRSTSEGGNFSGSGHEWWKLLSPFLQYAAIVDIERDYRALAHCVKDLGKRVISSFHTGSMPSPAELASIERDLRTYGDLPKIVVTPRNPDDLLALCSFTLHAEKPIITSIMGEEYSYARILLPLFGSAMTFGFAGVPASPGQFHAKEILELFRILHQPRSL